MFRENSGDASKSRTVQNDEESRIIALETKCLRQILSIAPTLTETNVEDCSSVKEPDRIDRAKALCIGRGRALWKSGDCLEEEIIQGTAGQGSVA